MSVIQIFDAPGEALFGKIKALVPADMCQEGVADVAVISPKAAGRAQDFTGRCSILLMPGYTRQCAIQPQCVVSYGLSQQDSITLSSIEGSKCVMALQREIMGTDKRIIEPQEFTVNAIGEPELTLAVYGAALILGGLGI